VRDDLRLFFQSSGLARMSQLSRRRDWFNSHDSKGVARHEAVCETFCRRDLCELLLPISCESLPFISLFFRTFFFAEHCNFTVSLHRSIATCLDRLLASDVADVPAYMPEAKGSKKPPDVLRLG